MSAPRCRRTGCGRGTWSPTGYCWQHDGTTDPDGAAPRVPAAQASPQLLGFTYEVPDLSGFQPTSPERALWRYGRALPEFVWDAAKLEGNPFTFPEVQTLLEGITVGGHRLSDEQQVKDLADAYILLRAVVNSEEFRLDKLTSDSLQHVVARHEALEAGHFRGEGAVVTNIAVPLGEYGTHHPPRTVAGGGNLREAYERGLEALEGVPVVERALAYNLFACLHQFYYDGNKRTSRLMMNGELLAHGYDAISVPARARLEFNTKMTRFYHTKDGSEMLAFYHDLAAAAQQ